MPVLEWDVPFLEPSEFRRVADAFLDRYHASRTIPVPIEEIVEFQMGLDVVPTPGLHETYDIDGYLSHDLTSIYVDLSFFEKRPARYRFTLAHEVAHLLLHRDFFESATFRTVSEWKDFARSFPEPAYAKFEDQAYRVGGLILIPHEHLAQEAARCIDVVRGEGIDLHEHWDFAWTRIAAHLAPLFDVSEGAVRKALEREGIQDTYRRS